MKTNLFFPGQGSQYAQMGLDFYRNYKTYKNIIDQVSELEGIDLLSILEDASKLNETENAQIAIFTMSYGITRLLEEEGIPMDSALGMSLGEYAALTLAEVLSYEDTLKLLRKRSELMQKASRETEGFLAAVSFMENDAVKDALDGLEKVWISNMNAANQTVVGGELQMKDEFEKRIKEKGGKKITYLQVSGAFHTPLMKTAGVAFKTYLDEFSLKQAKIPVLSNFKGDFYENEDDVKEILSKHIYSTVLLSCCIEKLDTKEEDMNIVLGPGKAMASILKQNKANGQTIIINSVEDFKTAVEILKERRNG